MTTSGGAALEMDAIFRNHYAWLRRWVNTHTPLGHSPEDVASETILRMVQFESREKIIEPRALMTAIARRILFDLRAKGDLHRAYEEAIHCMPLGWEPSVEDQLIAKEALARIDHALKSLSINARSAFLLSQIDGLRHAEIAGLIGVSVSMVRKYIAKAMRACYEEFKDDE